jgi:tetratricopeptide (TPR) repeat protein
MMDDSVLPLTLILEESLNNELSGHVHSYEEVCNLLNRVFTPSSLGKGSFISTTVASNLLNIAIRNVFDSPCPHDVIQLEYRQDSEIFFYYRYVIPFSSSISLSDEEEASLLADVNNANQQLGATKIVLIKLRQTDGGFAFELTRENSRACSYNARFLIGELLSFYYDIFRFVDLCTLTWALPIDDREIHEMLDRMNLMFALAQYHDSLDEANRILLRDQNCQDAYYCRAHSHYALESIDKSLDDFRKSTELCANDVDAINMIGVCLLRKEDYASALYEFNKCLEIDPVNTDSLYQRAQANLGLGDILAAIKDLSKAADLGDQMSEIKLEELSR